MEQLLEDYKRRLERLKFKIAANGNTPCGELRIKVTCYRTFISELEAIIKLK